MRLPCQLQLLTWSAHNDQRSFGLHADGNAEEVFPQGLVGGNPWRQLSSPDIQLQLILHHFSRAPDRPAALWLWRLRQPSLAGSPGAGVC